MTLPCNLRVLLTGPPPPPPAALLPDEGGLYVRDAVFGPPAVFPSRRRGHRIAFGDCTGTEIGRFFGSGARSRTTQDKGHSSGRGIAAGGGEGPLRRAETSRKGKSIRRSGTSRAKKRRRSIHSPAVFVWRTMALPSCLRALLTGPPPPPPGAPPRRGRPIRAGRSLRSHSCCSVLSTGTQGRMRRLAGGYANRSKTIIPCGSQNSCRKAGSLPRPPGPLWCTHRRSR